jgi:hypothetical protein
MREIKRRSAIFAGTAVFLALLFSVAAFSAEGEVFISEHFNDLRDWDPFYFRKIKAHSTYMVGQSDCESCLIAMSNSSASAVVHRGVFDVYEYPRIRWRWKVSGVYEKGNAKEKSGDDYPARVYIMFRYDPEGAPVGKKLRYGLARKLYGTYPPHSTLNYIWANMRHEEDILTNTYAEEARMVILRWGDEEAGKWIEEEVNVLEDYQRAFGENPPREARIAVMNDSDNTGEHSVSCIDYIEVYR